MSAPFENAPPAMVSVLLPPAIEPVVLGIMAVAMLPVREMEAMSQLVVCATVMAAPVTSPFMLGGVKVVTLPTFAWLTVCVAAGNTVRLHVPAPDWITVVRGLFALACAITIV